MQSGTLRQMAWVQVPVETRQPDGQVLTEFADQYPRYAALVSLNGSELMRAQQVQATVTHRVTLRSDSTTRELQPKARLRLGARLFNVLWVDQVEGRNREVRVYCVEEVTAGAT
jgi:SPP1 family predicted phage head-tail adaptor